jgi:hypothetical protein
LGWGERRESLNIREMNLLDFDVKNLKPMTLNIAC